MSKQLDLPGIPSQPTSADIKALVQARLAGFELRRQERAERRSRRAEAVATQEAPAPVQGALLPLRGEEEETAAP